MGAAADARGALSAEDEAAATLVGDIDVVAAIGGLLQELEAVTGAPDPEARSLLERAAAERDRTARAAERAAAAAAAADDDDDDDDYGGAGTEAPGSGERELAAVARAANELAARLDAVECAYGSLDDDAHRLIHDALRQPPSAQTPAAAAAAAAAAEEEAKCGGAASAQPRGRS